MMRLALGLGSFIYPVEPSFPSRFELIWLSGATAGGASNGALRAAAPLFVSSTLAPKSRDGCLASPRAHALSCARRESGHRRDLYWGSGHSSGIMKKFPVKFLRPDPAGLSMPCS